MYSKSIKKMNYIDYLKFLGLKKIETRYVILDRLYQLFIFLLIFWKIPFVIYLAIKNNNIIHVYDGAHSLIVSCQYILLYIYLKKDHFFDTVSSQGNDEKHIKYLIRSIICIFVLSLFYAITTMVVSITTNTILIYKELKMDNHTENAFIAIFMLIENIYSNNIFFSNLFIFGIVFLIHSNEIETFANLSIGTATIFNTCIQYTSIRNRYSITINLLNNLFSYTVLLGGVATYITIFNILKGYYDRNDFSNYVNGISYVVMLFVYFYSMGKIKEAIKMIKEQLLTDESIRRHINRTVDLNSMSQLVHAETLQNPPIEDNNALNIEFEEMYSSAQISTDEVNANIIQTQNISLKSLLLDVENGNSIDWLIIYLLIKEKWDSFELFGFVLEDSAILKKFLSIFWIYFSVITLRDSLKLG